MRRRAGEVGFGMIEVEERGRQEKGGTTSWTGPVVSERATGFVGQEGGQGSRAQNNRRETVGKGGRAPFVSGRDPVSPSDLLCCQATRGFRTAGREPGRPAHHACFG